MIKLVYIWEKKWSAWFHSI